MTGVVKGLPVTAPNLSIIIPTLNEATNLPSLLQDLANQQAVSFEVLVSDGGSTDVTCPLAIAFLTGQGMPFQVLNGPAGRGRQMNLAAEHAGGRWLLFLHADSRLNDQHLLRNGLDRLEQACSPAAGICRAAGHFTLKFDLPAEQTHLGFAFYEAKARLNEAGCTHGDQGFLLSSAFFAEVGPFREDLPVMEDTLLAETVRQQGRWLLLPGDIHTSPRRFLVEGLAARQTLNALLMNFLFVGWEDFLREAPTIYRQQRSAAGLQLAPFRREIIDRLRKMPFRQRWQLWYATGAYVRSQAWQLGFFFEVRRCFRSGMPLPTNFSVEDRPFRRWFDRLTDHPAGVCLTAFLTWIWFRVKFGRGSAAPLAGSRPGHRASGE